jgi:hypothetical protein
MEAQRMQRLEDLMAAMAAGDTAAIFALRGEYGGSIGAAVRDAVRRRGTVCGREEIESLVVDVCLMLFETAASWSPEGGALPWTWAKRRIGNLVDRHLGQFADPLDEQRDDRVVGGSTDATVSSDDPPVLEVLDRVSRAHAGARLLQEALGTVATARDRELFLELRIQELLGDRSPAVTVGALLGLNPEAVRQQHRRVRLRLRLLAESDARFAELAVLPLVA